MKFKAFINILPHSEILDPQGKAVLKGLSHIGIADVDNVRIGKHITLELNAEDEKSAHEKVEDACKKLLSNTITEQYSYQLVVL